MIPRETEAFIVERMHARAEDDHAAGESRIAGLSG